MDAVLMDSDGGAYKWQRVVQQRSPDDNLFFLGKEQIDGHIRKINDD